MPAASTASQPAPLPARLYYLDWLRVFAILGVFLFLFHAVHPFDLTVWHIKNAEQSTAITVFIAFVFPWGMPSSSCSPAPAVGSRFVAARTSSSFASACTACCCRSSLARYY